MAGQNLFNSVKLSKPGTSKFDLTHDVKMSCNMGELTPTLALECVPGDRFSIGCDSLLRFAPMVAPIMHRVDVTMHYFFVPLRLLWPNWEDFITNSGVHSVPTITMNVANYTPLADYLGIPSPEDVIDPVNEQVSAFPFAAYQMIWNEYYRDQNLQTAIDFNLVDGDNTLNSALTVIRDRCWEHDYFTAALPWAQKGGQVQIPIGGVEDMAVYRNTSPIADPVTTVDTTTSVDPLLIANLTSENTTIADDNLYADTSDLILDNTSINDLRRAFKLQEWLEKAARGGSRYVENILSFFGVKSPDARLNRPEYITGTKSPVVISEVLNTTGTTEQAQGDMAGHGVSVTQGRYGGYFCQEHGYIIGLMSIMPKTAYQQGIPRHFLKRSPFDYFWPQFDHIGEQEIENREIYAYTPEGGNGFGYIPRYAEYKYMPSRVAGDFRSDLAFWHMGRIFETAPALNATFVAADPTTRIFAVQDETVQKMWCHILHKISSNRPMSKYSTPTF